VLRTGLAHAAIGVLLGLAFVVGLGRILASRLAWPGLEPAPPLLLAALATVVIAVAFAATLVPALRAMRIDPARSLRTE
jgi:ABC-type antimicrobial peptide transport system permease subunit